MNRLHNLQELNWSLYAIIDHQWLQGREIGNVALQMIHGGATLIQYRDKVSHDNEFFQNASHLQQITRNQGIPFIINDRVDIAVAVQADGIHLGQNDLPVDVVRGIIGTDMIVGASVHSLPEYEKVKNADYFGVGTVFPTMTKTTAQVGGIDIVKQIRAVTSKPIVGIGGITIENLSHVIQAGAEGVAVISAILDHDDLKNATEGLKDAVTQARDLIQIV